MAAGGDAGWMRASDGDRSRVQTVLNDAFAEGRITRDEWEDRSTALAGPVTHADLAGLTRDLVALPPARPAARQFQPDQPTTNRMAIASLVCGLGQLVFPPFTGIAAIVLGHRARRQIQQTGDAGDGLAMTGLILGYIGTACLVLLILLAALVLAVHTSSSGGTG
jgi:hypothetical protein